jgi:pantoate--beta-alanine ligase
LNAELKPLKSGLRVVRTGEELRLWRQSLQAKADRGSLDSCPLEENIKWRVGLVTTMGALHQGHMSLIEHARKECQHVVVSIFVNPLQFAPHEDFDKYPRTLENDKKLCDEAGADLIFHPTVDTMYPGGKSTTTTVIPPPVLEKSLYGEFRPIFFSGVATVVARLFNIVQPNVAYFGEKDYQQLIVVKRMVSDLLMPIEIVGVETVREEDGLACSSRNVFLSAEQRKQAPVLYQTLQEISSACQKNADGLAQALAVGRKRIEAIPDVDLKYLVACRPTTLVQLHRAEKPMVLLVAAKFKEIWLIDTLLIQ